MVCWFADGGVMTMVQYDGVGGWLLFVIVIRDTMQVHATCTQNSIEFIFNKALVTYLGVLYSNIYLQIIFILQARSMKTLLDVLYT